MASTMIMTNIGSGGGGGGKDELYVDPESLVETIKRKKLDNVEKGKRDLAKWQRQRRELHQLQKHLQRPSTFAILIPDINKMWLMSQLDAYRGKITIFEGIISVGKTTTCLGMKRLFDLAGVPCSVFKEEPGQKALGAFLDWEKEKVDKELEGPNPNAFPLQILMCGNRLLSYQRATFQAVRKDVVLMDRSLDGDRAFMEMQHEKGNISEEQRQVYLEHVMANAQYFIKPHLVVYLTATAEKSMDRVYRRGNEGEKKAYTAEYMLDLDRHYWNCLRNPIGLDLSAESSDNDNNNNNSANGFASALPASYNLKVYSVEEDDEDLVQFASEDTVVPYIEPEWKVKRNVETYRSANGGKDPIVISEISFKKTVHKLLEMLRNEPTAPPTLTF